MTHLSGTHKKWTHSLSIAIICLGTYLFALSGVTSAGELRVDNPNWQAPGNDIQVDWGSNTQICADYFCIINDPGLIDGVTAVTVTAIPSAGYVFDFWDFDISGAANPHTFTFSNWMTARGNFRPVIYYQLDVSIAGGSGTVTSVPAGINCGADCNEDYAEDTTVTLTAAADSGFIFAGWYDDAMTLISTNPTLAVLIDASKNITAEFTKTYVLNLNTTGSGTGVVAADQTAAVALNTYRAGTVVQITATTAADAVFESWTLNAGTGPIADTSATTTTVTMNSDNTVTADFSRTYVLTLNTAGSGSGTAVADQTDAVALNTYRIGTIVQITATPAADVVFENWTLDVGTGPIADTTAASTTVTMDADNTVTVDFSQTFILTLGTTGSGSGTAVADQTDAVAPNTYRAGTVVQITATPAADAVFENWTLNAGTGPIADMLAAATTVTMDSDNTATADFTQLYVLTLNTAGTGLGIVAADQTDAVAPNTYRIGTVVQITATPDSCSNFTDWSGDHSGSINPDAITMDADKTVTVTFTIKTFTITATAGPNGSITPSGAVSVNCGSDQAFTITPDFAGGYNSVSDLVVDGISQGEGVTAYTFPNVTADHSISATFEDHGGDCSNSTLVAPNSTTNGSIDSNGDEDFYQVDIPSPGGVITVYTEYTGDQTDTFGYLLDAGCNQITYNDDGGAQSNFQILQVVTPGTYFIRVRNYYPDRTGTYILHVEYETDDHGSDLASATAATCGSTTAGRIYPAGNWDYFRLDLANMGLITISSSGNEDTYGYFLDSAGNEITHDNDSGSSQNFFIERMLDAATYYIAVRHYNASQTGDYSLDIQCSLSYTITAGAAYGGIISPAGTIILSQGGSQTFTINPHVGNAVADVMVDGASMGAVSTYTVSNINADHIIVATFDVPPEACVDISDVPLDVKQQGAPANIMFVMDDSGTMDWEFMTTDDDGKFKVGNSDYEYLYDLEDKLYKTGTHSHVLGGADRMNWQSQWSDVNKVYYDPAIDYEPWPTLSDADPDNPRSFPMEAIPTLNLSDTFYSFDAGTGTKIVDNQDSEFSFSFPEVIVDDQDLNFSISTPDGNWAGGIHSEAYKDDYQATVSNGDYTAIWTPDLPAAGQYAVYARWRADSSRSTAVPYSITHATGSDTVTVDQRQNGGDWVLLGTYDFDQGSSGDVSINVIITDVSTESVCADAVKFVLNDGWDWATDSAAYHDHYYWTAKDGTYTATWTPNMAAGEYNVYAKWVHNATRSQAVPYTINHFAGTATVSVDKRQDDGDWYLLGTYTFDAGTGDVSVTYTRNGDDDTVCADAVKFVPTASSVIDIKNAHYYVWSDLTGKPYLVVVDGGSIRYWEVSDDGDDLIEAGELFETTSPPPDVQTSRSYVDERQNFANWFQYYRKRDLLTRGAIGEVISSMQGVQIGLRGINGVLIQPVLRVKVGGADYTSTLLSGLYAYRLDGHRAATPLRAGLEEVGRYFDQDDGDDGGVGPSPIATEEDGGACQQNFAVVFTDSYYNGLPPHVSNADGDNGLPYADTGVNTLADVAIYYYENDLADNVADRVSVNPADDAIHQHMVTYGITFGVYGTLNPDDYDLENCTVATCPPWPVPITAANDKRFKIDDLWHASVNGRGTFMSAANPDELIEAFRAVMQNIESRIGSAASVSVNGDELYGVLDDDVRMYQSSYSSDGWVGDVKAYALDPATGEVITTSYVFSAATELDKLDPNNRIIATYDGSSAGTPFRFDDLTTVQKDLVVDGAEADYTAATNRLNYLRGDVSNEVQYGGAFRNRYQRLGDIVHSSPVFENGVLYAGGNDGMLHAFDASDGRELFAYVPNLVFENLKELTRPNYSHRFFVDLSPSIRRGVKKPDNTEITVLVGGLGKGGKGYYALDITDPPAITNEFFLAQQVLWEFPRTGTDPANIADLGYSYNRPSIVKSNDADRWLVIFGNGYSSPNGHAVLFIVDPVDGTLIKKIDTGVGDCNGLSAPVAIDIDADQKVDYVYAGDLKGNLWKFDLTGNISDWKVAFNDSGTPKPLFQAKDGVNPQPITSKPDVMFHCEMDGLMVVFGTGKYLGDTDFLDTSLQTIYGIWDYSDPNDPSEYLGSFERGSTPQLSNQPNSVYLLQQTEVPGTYFAPNGTQLRILTDNAANWQTTTLAVDGISCTPGSGEGLTECDPNGVGVKSDPDYHAGWYFDLPISGERVPDDIMIRNKKAVVIGFIPENTACGSGGDSFVMEMNACTGGRLSNPQFDINADGKVDANDMIALTDADGNTLYDGDGNPIMVVPTGMMFPGRLLPPAILRTGDEEIKYFSTNVGTIITMREKAVPMGIIYWMEVIP